VPLASYPAPLVEIAFTTDPGATPTYVDVTSYLRGGSIRRGRQNELGRYEAGTATLLLNNRGRAFDPTFATSPFFPNIKPMKKVRISATWNSIVYRLFTGFIESWPQDWPGNKDGVVEVSATEYTPDPPISGVTSAEMVVASGAGRTVAR